MSLIEQVEEIALPVVSEKNAFIVEITLRGNQGQKVLELFLDTDTGVTTEQCAEISRALSHALDAADLIRGRYHLVVSSPGTDRPLKFPRQFANNVGRTLTLRVRQGDQVVTVDGILTDATTAGIVLEPENADPRTVKFEEIVEARVRTPW